MTNIIQLKSVRELMNCNYFIPAYQRGYRWTKPQIDDLLNDIYSFADKKNKDEKEFYCLQPIVVRKLTESDINKLNGLIDRKEWDTYEVIDGQQRLTTLKILLRFLEEKILLGRSTLKEEYGFEIYDIVYETRPELKNIFASQLKQQNEENIDFSHITNAYYFINLWFRKKVDEGESLRDLCETIIRTLAFDAKRQKPEGIVQVIWYEQRDGSNPVETFLRINLGKIPLTNAELVKALLLQDGIYGDGELAELQKIEIAQKWDQIENSLHDDDFWWFISNESYHGSTRIEYLLNIIYQQELAKDEKLQEVTGDDAHQVFRFYFYELEKAKNILGVKEIWEKIEELYDQISEWFRNQEWYHYVGFLIYNGRSVIDILKIIENKSLELQKKEILQSEFTEALIEEISGIIKNVEWSSFITSKDEKEEDENDIKYLKVGYKKSDLVRNLLLLYNLQFIVKQSIDNKLFYRFPFYDFKNLKDESGKSISWDIEHIDSSTDNQLDKIADQKMWLENAKIDIPYLDLETIVQIDEYLKKEKIGDEFYLLYDKIRKIANEENNDDELRDNIGNLTLLDSKTNRGYGNALFMTKRRKIIEKDKKGIFIPMQTKNIFLKYNNVNNMKSYWTKEDIHYYNLNIVETLSIFLKP